MFFLFLLRGIYYQKEEKIISISPNYQEQFKRVKRWYKRFEEINNGLIHDKPSEFYGDDIYAFFMNCYHLKDWIKEDPSAASVANKVENYINNNPELSLCADICNGLKHFHFTGYRSGENPEFGKTKAELNFGSGPTTIALKYEIKTKSGSIDAFDLATKCIKAWEVFIKSII